MSQPPALLLLPPPPSPSNQASIAVAYRPSIDATISQLKGLPTSTELLVAVPCPSLHGRLQGPRSHIYTEAQELVKHLYSLISLVCVQSSGVGVLSDEPGAVDARVILLDYDPSQTFSAENRYVLESSAAGPIIDIVTFALTRRRWTSIFSVDGEEGQKVLASYTNIANSTSPPVQGQHQLVSGGVSMVHKEACSNKPLTTSTIHNVVIIGGTFDHLHAGHKLLLTAASVLLQSQGRKPRRLIVGITGDELLKDKKYAEFLKSWKQRQEDVVDFLQSIILFTNSSAEEATETVYFNEPGPNGHAIHTKLAASSITIECVEIEDPFGPTITDASVSALVVSAETRSGGQAVIKKREEKGLKPLEVFEVDVLDAEETEESSAKIEGFASKISSTAIRKQKADLARMLSL